MDKAGDILTEGIVCLDGVELDGAILWHDCNIVIHGLVSLSGGRVEVSGRVRDFALLAVSLQDTLRALLHKIEGKFGGVGLHAAGERAKYDGVGVFLHFEFNRLLIGQRVIFKMIKFLLVALLTTVDAKKKVKKVRPKA